jgi:predicted dehydrogenase
MGHMMLQDTQPGAAPEGASDGRVRLAVVGCGEIAKRRHLPLLAESDESETVAVVDRDESRLALAGTILPDALPLRDVDELRGLELDAAVVTLPNELHAPVATQLMERGLDVLVEKPLARSAEEARAMIATAERHGRVLGVAMMMRFEPTVLVLRQMLRTGVLDPVESITVDYGFESKWPFTRPTMLQREHAGGGALLDMGPHILDLLAFLFGGYDIRSVEDDAHGGVESEAHLELLLPGGVPCRVGISRARGLGSSLVLRNERATLEVDLAQNRVRFRDDSRRRWEIDGRAVVPDHPLRDPASVAGKPGLTSTADLLSDFIQSVRSRRAPAADGASGLRTLELVERCYSLRQPQRHPWELPVAPGVSL